MLKTNDLVGRSEMHYFQRLIYVGLQFKVVQNQIFRVLIIHYSSIPQDEDDENVVALGQVEE